MDQTEQVRRIMVNEIISETTERNGLEGKYGQYGILNN